MKNKTIVGVQSSSVKKYLTSEKSVKESFQKFYNSGYRYTQIQWVDKSVSAIELKKALDSTGIKAISVQDYYIEFLKDENYYLELCKTLWCEDLTLSGVPEELMSEEGCLKFAKDFNDLSLRLKNFGLTLSFHPRNHEFRPIITNSATDIVMKNSDVLLCLDGFHCYTGGINPGDIINKYQGRISAVHFKEYKGNDINNLCPIGSGSINWSKTFKACNEYGVKYCYTEQERWSEDPFILLKQSLDYLLSIDGFENE